ncbi:unnamed protein product (macronuclear) [Paramecium tetraurelia]|uniref:PX domain-containing protein n=1 Tax=Paramecium tetraurelia TaxID=5888 RepID=A0CNK7_PARTE|nr:uncharacterized protein GSPATT00008816001 [Paramecium tetraurelia]CAK72374.1 unnamed protein product [Paramecium tetraurelia]|eukprot:XP_001439771.1 hypothetical protein (macronuclear) [Paramecium tetraurelia strain d4-2]
MSIVNLDETEQNQHQDLKESQDIQIDIITFDQHESLLDTYTYYIIKGKDKIGFFEVYRRYKDFISLRDILLIRWPGCFIPGIPGKKMFQGNDTKTASERLRFLKQFCNKMKLLPNLYYSQEFSQLFLRSKDKEIHKTFEQMPKPKTSELIQKYQLNFIELQGRDIDQTLDKKIEGFVEKLKNNQIQLKLAKKYIRDLYQSQEQYNQSLEKIMTMHLPNYEKQFIQTYQNNRCDNLLLTNQNIKKQLDTQYNQNGIFKRRNIDKLYEYIRQELKDIKAFYQSLKTKKEYEEQKKKLEAKQLETQQELNNLNEGKNPNFFKNIFNKQTPEQLKSHLNIQIQTNQNELDNLQNLIDIMQAIIGFIEIERFQDLKIKFYSVIIKQVSELEQKLIDEQIQYWQYIESQSSNLINQLQFGSQEGFNKQQFNQPIEQQQEEKEEVEQNQPYENENPNEINQEENNNEEINQQVNENENEGENEDNQQQQEDEVEVNISQQEIEDENQ